MAGRAFFRAEDGTETDITSLVEILWDGVVGSLDWGSGWWSAEDAAAVAWIGHLFGFAPESGRWTPAEFAEAIARYEQIRKVADANLPPLP